MVDIATITPNPAVDLSTSVDKILPVAKLRGNVATPAEAELT